MHPVTIVGCGYTGSRLAMRCLNLRRSVRGFGRGAESVKRIEALGAQARVLDLDQPSTLRIDVADQLVYYTVPPARTSRITSPLRAAPSAGTPPSHDPLPSAASSDGPRDERLERLLSGLSGAPRRVIYLSTTAVYGDRSGAVVDENALPQPKSERAVRRLAAETTLRAWAETQRISWCILRIPGIYGPGRLPLERLRRGDPAISPAEAAPGNRIHVDDLVTACMAAGVAPAADRRIYNVTDGNDDSLTAYLQRWPASAACRRRRS